MSNFVWGVIVGAAITWLALNGTEPLYRAAAGVWADVSRPPVEAEP